MAGACVEKDETVHLMPPGRNLNIVALNVDAASIMHYDRHRTLYYIFWLFVFMLAIVTQQIIYENAL